jgi:membrane protein DedA with SNARE-associated domain
MRRGDSGAAVLGVILMLVGGYFLARELGIWLPDMDWDVVWPVIVLVVGVVLVLRAWRRV